MSKMHSEGVTLIELMVTMFVFAVILAAGVPAFMDFLATNRMSAAVNDVVTSLHLARTEAVKRRANVTLCASSGGENCESPAGPGQGWIVFVDCSTGEPESETGCGTPNGAVDSFDKIIHKHGPLPEDIGDKISMADVNDGNPVSDFLVSFTPSGYSQDAAGNICVDGGVACVGHLQFCDRRGSREAAGGSASGRWVKITKTGRPRIFSSHQLVQSTDNPLHGCPDPV